MYRFNEIVCPESAQEAWEMLHAHRDNAVLGGGAWMALGRNRYRRLIDLAHLGLGGAEQRGEEIWLGAGVTLRQLETDGLTKTAFGGVLARSVRPVVGVQLRNAATVGGSVYGRFGFSELLCALMTLDARVLLHGGGAVQLEAFARGGCAGRDILLGLFLPDDGRRAAIESFRLTATDLPLLTVAAAVGPQGWRLAAGARPARAVRAPRAEALLDSGGTAEEAARALAGELTFGGNARASAQYRRHLAEVLAARAVRQVQWEPLAFSK